MNVIFVEQTASVARLNNTCTLSIHGGWVANAIGFNARDRGFAAQRRQHVW